MISQRSPLYDSIIQMSSQERGNLPLSVQIRSTKWLAFGWSAFVLIVAILILQVAAHQRPPVGALLPAMAFLLVRLLHPTMRVYENGVDLPAESKENKPGRFLRWEQIERYSWDHNVLILAGTQSFLSGGPVDGGSVTIPPSEIRRLDLLLAAMIGRR